MLNIRELTERIASKRFFPKLFNKSAHKLLANGILQIKQKRRAAQQEGQHNVQRIRKNNKLNDQFCGPQAVKFNSAYLYAVSSHALQDNLL